MSSLSLALYHAFSLSRSLSITLSLSLSLYHSFSLALTISLSLYHSFSLSCSLSLSLFLSLSITVTMLKCLKICDGKNIARLVFTAAAISKKSFDSDGEGLLSLLMHQNSLQVLIRLNSFQTAVSQKRNPHQNIEVSELSGALDGHSIHSQVHTGILVTKPHWPSERSANLAVTQNDSYSPEPPPTRS